MNNTFDHRNTLQTSTCDDLLLSSPLLKSFLKDTPYCSYIALSICNILSFLSFLCSVMIREHSGSQLTLSFTFRKYQKIKMANLDSS